VEKSVWERIEDSRERHNVLEHEFYVRWSEGDLTGEELADYAGQYRHATAAIARLCADAAADAPAETGDELRRHASEEEAHIGLWDDFVEAAGGTIGAEPHAETAECVEEWTAPGSYLESLGRLYAIESGQPEIAKIKRDGLVSLYGFNEGPATEYFRVHETDDIAHTEESRRLIEAAMSPEDADRVVAAAESAFKANLRLLDGVQR
jgi:pyrroloquinoline-quinone synthase